MWESVWKRFGRGLVATVIVAAATYAVAYLQALPAGTGTEALIVGVLISVLNALSKGVRESGGPSLPI